jgi:polysaccharide biosynthesis/export protein
VQLADTSTNYHLRPGDRIYVPTRGLCETLCPDKTDCGPCGGTQSPCPIPPAVDGAHPESAVAPPGKMAQPESLPVPNPPAGDSPPAK